MVLVPLVIFTTHMLLKWLRWEISLGGQRAWLKTSLLTLDKSKLYFKKIVIDFFFSEQSWFELVELILLQDNFFLHWFKISYDNLSGIACNFVLTSTQCHLNFMDVRWTLKQRCVFHWESNFFLVPLVILFWRQSNDIIDVVTITL